MDSIFQAIIDGETELGNYYVISNIIENLKLSGTVKAKFTEHCFRYVDVLAETALSMDATIYTHTQLVTSLRGFMSKVLELISVYHLHKNIYKWWLIKAVYSRYYEKAMSRYVVQLINSLKTLPPITVRQAEELASHLDNIIVFSKYFDSFDSRKFQKAIDKVLQGSTGDYLLRYHHESIIKGSPVTNKISKIVRNYSRLEKYYIKYLQIRLLNNASSDDEIAMNKRIFRSDRVTALINDATKSRIIARNNIVKNIKPAIINRKLWDIVNDIPFSYPTCVTNLLDSVARHIEERYIGHVRWANGLGKASVKLGDTIISCNMYQFTALILSNERQLTIESFAEECKTTVRFAELVLESLIEANVLDSEYSPCRMFLDKIDADVYFRRLVVN